MEATTGGPMVRFWTKWPSITSRCSMVAPPRSTCAICSPNRAKSAARIDGTISTICGILRFYHSGEKAVAGVAPGNPLHGLDHQFGRHGGYHVFILFAFERAGGIDQQTAGRQGM